VTSRRRGLCVVVCALLAGGCGTAAPDHPPQVLAVTVRTGGLVPQTATGVATGGDRVLTVAHVLTGGHAVAVGGRPARIVRLDRRLDLAVLAVPGLRAARVRLGGGEARRVGIVVLRDRVARTLAGRIRRRVIVHWREQPADPPRDRPGLELAASVEPGDSGGPVVDRDGRLLGVLYARSSDAGDTAWAVDAAAVRVVLARSSPGARVVARARGCRRKER